MEVTGVRAWQWMFIGALAGAAVGYAWTNLPHDLERTGDRNQFQAQVRRTAGAIARGQPPLVRNVVVQEPERDPSNVLVYPVTFEQLQVVRPRTLNDVLKQASQGKNTPPAAAPAPTYVASGIYAPTPFVGQQSIVDFLKANKVPFTDRSGAGKYVPVYYGTAGGFLVIGLLWPVAIQLMIRAGLAKAPPPRPKKEKKQHRTGEDFDEMISKPAEKKIEAGALDALNDAMEASLAAGLESGGPRATTPTVTAEPVSVLMTGGSSKNAADPTERPLPTTPEEHKDYGGEYYPVARTVKKDGEKH